MENAPRVFSFNIAWNQAEGEMNKVLDIIGVLSLIPNIFDPKDLFSQIDCPDSTLYFFKGMICFWGCHYFAYFRDFESKNASDCWKLYDDTRVVNIGDWDSVLRRCLDGKEKPILLLFEEMKTKDS